MGTRGAYGFRLNGKDYVSYNHFDSYPSGLGADILADAKKLARDKKLKEKVAAIKLVTDETPPTQADVEKCAKFTNLSVGDQKVEDWYCLLRNCQGKLADGLGLGIMIDSSEFLLDSLFCEWAYILNLDEGELEVYKGFNKNPKAAGRYAALHRERDGEYYGVELMTTYPLDALPAKTQFLKETEESEEEVQA